MLFGWGGGLSSTRHFRKKREVAECMADDAGAGVYIKVPDMMICHVLYLRNQQGNRDGLGRAESENCIPAAVLPRGGECIQVAVLT
jgi:hypothetical protein